MRNDVKDRHVAATAVRAGATLIVTSNLRDFPADTLAPFGVEAQSPDAFLSRLFAIDPDAVVASLVQQAASYRMPPRSVDELLARLDKAAPAFGGLVRRALEAYP